MCIRDSWTPETNNYILSVNSINSISSFEVYPNPVSDVVNVKFNLNKNESITYVIKDLSGREVSQKTEKNLSAGLNNFSVNTSELSKGIYFLNITTHTGEKTVRLIK